MLTLDTIRQFMQTHPKKLLLVLAGVAVYAVLNVWVYRIATKGGASSPIAAIQSFFAKNLPRLPGAGSSGGFPVTPTPIRIDTGKSIAPASRELLPTPTPTPRPTGPGQYACGPEGVCNLYSDEVRKQYCTTTYADPGCLNQCGDTAKRCTK